uniref:ATPase AAA-type core domain-containing protein n=1 Tax=Oryza meridionalis TaxID=40149 RepID=A0A0E0FCN5_9ORYZ
MALAVDDHEAITDDFRGATMWWSKTKALPNANVITWSPRNAERCNYRLTFHLRHRALVKNAYLCHVLAKGRAVTVRNRQHRLFTNNHSRQGMFRDGREYCASVGKAWKRGYLLCGPPGTDKSNMIAAMANFLEYDVYDLERGGLGEAAVGPRWRQSGAAAAWARRRRAAWQGFVMRSSSSSWSSRASSR